MAPHNSGAPPDESSTGRHIPALDGIRGLAILMVLACHLLASNPYPGGNLLVRFFARAHGEGWIGVDLFFVLSGFLITGILYDTLGDSDYFRNFYARRMLRIFPAYYGFVLLLVAVTVVTGNHWFAGLWQILTYTENLPIVASWVTDARWINLNHFWSLAVEEQFYLVWPLLVFTLRKRRAICMVAAAGMVASLLIRVAWVRWTNIDAHPYVVYSWTPARLDGLLAGALVAMAVRGRYRLRVLQSAPAVLLGGVLLLGALFAQNGSLSWEGHPFAAILDPLLLAVTFAGLLGCVLRPRALAARVMANPVLTFYGRYSYGLYLFHYTITTLLQPLRRHLETGNGSRLVSVLVPATVAFALTTGAAWLSFHLFEARFLRLKDRFSNQARRPRLAEVEAKIAAEAG